MSDEGISSIHDLVICDLDLVIEDIISWSARYDAECRSKITKSHIEDQ
jgi:hypothetical protein